MRKLFSLFVTILVTTSLWAYDFQSGDLYYNITSSSEPYTVEVTYQEFLHPANYSSLTTATIPASVIYNDITYSVTSIGDEAFSYCSSLTSITIPNSVTSIGEGAFYECSSLTSITIPNSVTSIGEDAFSWCSSLTSVTIPNSVTSIGSAAFSRCSSLTSVTIPNSVTSIGNSAFSYCSKLTSVTIPNSVTSIGVGTFENCVSLTSITIPNSVRSIGYRAFYQCLSLESITIPNSVTSIGEDAFWACSSLTSITIPNSVRSIGDGAFSWCSSIDTVYIKAIQPPLLGGLSFWDVSPFICYIPLGTLENYKASDWAEYVSQFVEIEYPVDPTCQITYASSNGKVVKPYKTDVFGANIVSNEYKDKIGTITFDGPVTSIGESAFENCFSLTSITIPNSVTSIGVNAFYYCDSLTSITIPNSVTSIGDDAFYGCSSLTSITIPNSVTSIGGSAFYNCSALTSITIPNSVTEIRSRAFEGCTSLQYLSIPNSVKYPSPNDKFGAYYDIMTCPNLKTLIVPADFFEFKDEEYLYAKSELLPYFPEQLESLTINDGTIHRLIWDFINRNYKTLKTIDLAATTDIAIAEEAFKNCYKLEKLALPSQLEYIPYMAIAECVKLQSITIPATVTEIEDRAFENCRSIKSIIFEGAAPAQGPAHHAAATGSSLWRIGSWAFYNCHQLQDLTIPEGVTEVGDAAFYGCTYLEDMVLPSTIQEIGDNGFALCAKLQKIHVKAATPPTIQAKTFFDVNRQIPVYVPDNAVEAYEDDPYWQEFDIQGESKAPSAVDNIPSAVTNTKKIMSNGQLLILRDGKTYTIMGAEIH